MGYRHQVYVLLPPCAQCKGTGARPEIPLQGGCDGCLGRGLLHGRVLGFSRPHLPAPQPLRHLSALLMYIWRSDLRFAPVLEHAPSVFETVWALDVEQGHFEKPRRLIDGELDPLAHENDTGITVVDLRHLRPAMVPDVRVSLVSLGRLEGALTQPPPFVPLPPSTYLSCYYPGLFARRRRRLHGEEGETVQRLLEVLDGVERWKPGRITDAELHAALPALGAAYRRDVTS